MLGKLWGYFTLRSFKNDSYLKEKKIQAPETKFCPISIIMLTIRILNIPDDLFEIIDKKGKKYTFFDTAAIRR